MICHTHGNANGHGCEKECLTCTLMCCIGCGCCYSLAIRAKIRQKYGVSGNLLTDCIAMSCFGNCAMMQHVNQAGDQPPCNGKIAIACPPALAKIDAAISGPVAKLG